MPVAIIMDLSCIQRFLAQDAVPAHWDSNFDFSDSELGIFTRSDDGVVVILSDASKPADPVLVISLEPGKLFSGFNNSETRKDALFRTLKAADSVFERGGQLPDYWRPHSRGEYITFQATSISARDSRRMVLWRQMQPTPCCYIFDLTASQKDYEQLLPNHKLRERANNARLNVLQGTLTTALPPKVTPSVVELDNLSGRDFVLTAGVDAIYKRHLTAKQREFVDFSLNQPIRLKGAAGTGKTLAMIVKILRESYKKKSAGERFRFLYLTHNDTAADDVRKYISILDTTALSNGSGEQQSIRVSTLLGLANEHMQLVESEFRTISIDGHEGKWLQVYLLSDIISNYARGAWLARRMRVNPDFRKRIEVEVDSTEHLALCWDVMNEIATALDAEGVRDRQDRRDRYLNKSDRPRYLMNLPDVAERQTVLDIYDLYRDRLRKEGLISVDQLIADYLGYLDSYRWDTLRRNEGFDAIFVDEFHLFNAQERAVFVQLIRDPKLVPIILMALDPRQSPREAFLNLHIAEVKRSPDLSAPGIREPKRFEFTDVFRYTPQILNLLHYVNQSFPVDDLGEDFLASDIVSKVASGEHPWALALAGRAEQYVKAFELARRNTREKESVAVLSLSVDAFNQIKGAGKFAGQFVLVETRQDLARRFVRGRKPIFSMPEYVSGYQFDSVILADVNLRGDEGARTAAMHKRRFISNLYLGASRARSRVYLLADQTRGGLAEEIKRAITDGIVRDLIP